MKSEIQKFALKIRNYPICTGTIGGYVTSGNLPQLSLITKTAAKEFIAVQSGGVYRHPAASSSPCMVPSAIACRTSGHAMPTPVTAPHMRAHSAQISFGSDDAATTLKSERPFIC